ncbi:MAG: GNAT family acetyltransferase [Pseudomonadota bacterium]
MNDLVRIRDYDDRDRAAVVHVFETVLPDAQPHNQPEPVIDAKLAVDDMLYVADLDGQVVGTCMAGYDGHRGWLYSVAVLETHQRRGIASRLVQHALANLKARGCLKVNLQVRAGNEAVIGFYESLGFATEARVSMGIRL